jgi:branched-subunit amino acid aminotransferase/4-amino-4-deoxychorismate lyase
MLTPTKKIWHNGRFIPWDEAQIHVLSHVVSYGSSVFEGIRCYATSNGPAVFRIHEHVRRMADSAKIYRMDLPYGREELAEAMLELVRVNGLPPATSVRSHFGRTAKSASTRSRTQSMCILLAGSGASTWESRRWRKAWTCVCPAGNGSLRIRCPLSPRRAPIT